MNLYGSWFDDVTEIRFTRQWFGFARGYVIRNGVRWEIEYLDGEGWFLWPPHW